MKKSVYGRKLGRDKNARHALFRGLMSSLVLEDRIQTSEAKAKAIKPEMERLVTKALKGGNSSAKIIAQSIYPYAVERFVKDVAPRFKDRKGGYTRIIKIGADLGSRSPRVILEWVEMPKAVAVLDTKAPKSTVKKVEVKKAPVKKAAAKKPAVKKPAPKKAKGKTK